jgi:urea transporter
MEQLLEERVEYEQDVMAGVLESTGWLLKTYGEAVMPVIQAIMEPLVAPMIKPPNDLELRQFATCMYLDVVEYGGRFGAPAIPVLMPQLVQVWLRVLVDQLTEACD